jgi:hypothetical protein
MIIGFCGPLGSGKTTAANHLIEAHGFTRHRLAGPLKAMMRALGLSERHTDGDLKEVPCDLLGGKTPRNAMQTLGKEWGRDLVSATLWVDAWKATMPDGDLVVEDVRFPNEPKLIRSLDDLGILIHVARPMKDDLERAHSSENQDLGAFDHEIVNEGSITDLQAAVDRVVAGYSG